MTSPAGGSRTPTEQAVSVRPLRPGSAFGVEVSGMDLGQPLAPETRRALTGLLFAHQVLVWRGQRLGAEQQVALAGAFGAVRVARQSPHYPCSHPQAHYLSTLDRQGRPTHLHPDPHTAYWHSDGSWMQTPPLATVLHAVDVAAPNGDTSFACMYELAAALGPELRRELADAKAVHHVELSRARRDRRWPWQWRLWPRARRPSLDDVAWLVRLGLGGPARDAAVHPVLRRHPRTGRETLFIGDHAWRLTGTGPLAGIRRMRQLNESALRAATGYTHQWRTGDVVIWDNGSVLHKAEALDLGKARALRRCVVLGPMPASASNPGERDADA